jgi:hypothetical protein
MRFHADKLPAGYSFGCSIRAIKKLLKTLPPEDLRGIQSVRLCVHHSRDDGIYLLDGRIELRWAVDGQGRRRIGRRGPSPASREELEQFGGMCVVERGIHYSCWANRKQLERYVLFVLLHEIGHHVFARQYRWRKRRLTPAQEEEFADAYARRYVPGESTSFDTAPRRRTMPNCGW